MCDLKKTFVIVANFFLCCLSLAGIGLLVYRSHEEGLLNSDALQTQKLNLPLAEGCVLVVVVITAVLGIVGIIKRASTVLIVHGVILQLLLMAEVTLCGYYAGRQSGTNIFLEKLSQVLSVVEFDENFSVDIDGDSASSTSLIVIVALQITVQELSIISTMLIACRMKFDIDEIPDYRSSSYRPVKGRTQHP